MALQPKEIEDPSVSQQVMQEISGMVRWMRLITVLLLVLVGIFGVLLPIAAIFVVTETTRGIDTLPATLAILAPIWAAMLGYYIWTLVSKCTKKYAQFSAIQDMKDFEAALESERKVWTHVGYILLVGIAAVVVFCVSVAFYFN